MCVFAGFFNCGHIAKPFPQESLRFGITSANALKGNGTFKGHPHRPFRPRSRQPVFEIDARGEAPYVGYEVEHDDAVLTLGYSKTSPELLHKYAPAVCDPLKHEQIYIRNVNSFVEHIDSAYDIEFAIAEICQSATPLYRGHLVTAPR